MNVDASGEWLSGVRRVASPNWDERPAGEVSLIVVHGISLPPGEFGGPAIDALFTNTLDAQGHPYFEKIAHLRVSSHVLIRRDGAVVQYVPFNRRAWHAGESCFQGRCACNDFSVGIELEGTDEQPYTDAQYDRLAAVIKALQAAFPRIKADHVVGHSDVAPGRKSDPGPAFQWPRLWTLLGESVPT
ncbi:MAG TPA: 1,6-anhydro-N-acetylmuramyl-L-alanine amidase AmpD [Gammaproteobacteria bacterium]|nr:1,6-anhydro-N-acetylmuramyl-L-alanine amidase AmpD [Gammaproteobacteria bacterium]